jgi:serine/threonine protein phosphatase PrpC
MTADLDNGGKPQEHEEDQEITARFSRDELVRSWREREPRIPRAVPTIRFAVKTDLGRIRENNEDKSDFYEPDDPTLLAARGSFYAVADGMGGHAAGQIASELALKTVISSYYDSPNDDIPTSLLEAVAVGNETVHNVALMVPDRKGMGTTLTAAVFAEDRVYVVQVGDSRAYLIRDDAIRQVTFDHSWVAEQVRANILTAEEAENSPYRNVITRALGTQELIEPEVFVEETRPGDVWVLCSDGLTGHVQDDEIRSIASTQPPSEAARQLIELANSRGGRDNITVFVVEVRGLSPCDRSAEPAAPGALPPLESATEKRGIKRLFGK